MKVFTSNKLEILSSHLAHELKEPLSSPLASETIIVQSSGMQKWLSLELARHHGICANYQFPFPNKFLEEVFTAFIPQYKPDQAYDINVLTWKLMELLSIQTIEDDFGPVRNYLGNNDDQLKLYQLARRIAVMFDQYLVFRPEMILNWEEGGKINDPKEIWQARLWRKIAANQNGLHKAKLKKLYLSKVKDSPYRKDILPQRISIFGISYLPPYHLEVFFHLARHIPVNYFYLNPSQEFWADIKSGREISSSMKKLKEKAGNMEEELLHLESGNALLASLGTLGRDFFRQMDNVTAEYIDLFVEPKGESLLSSIHSDIYLLQNRGKEDIPRKEVMPEDESLQIHSCHSPLREVETLHDVLLSLFEKNRQLLPKDVLVMTPNIEMYAPYIEAVFTARAPKIPYSIADRNDDAQSIVARGFFAALAMSASRFTASDVLSLLENTAVSEKFAITASELSTIRDWVYDTRIKWGINGAQRREFDLPEFSQNSWQAGLERMLLGYAMDGRRQDLFSGILPYGKIEGDAADLLGRFLNFWEKIIDAREILRHRKTINDWCSALKKIINDLFPATDHYRNELYTLHTLISELHEEQQCAKSASLLEVNIIRNYLQKAMEGRVASSHFLSGSVTFCAMLPMRSIPFDVICMLGMNNEAFPRQDHKAGFDLMEANKRAGDRSLRKDDQYLFLETILSAGSHLIICYTGQDQKDNSTILPSVLVSELLNYIDQGYFGARSEAISGRITRWHHLHAFHPAYFDDEKKAQLYSYSRENYLAAEAICAQREEKPLFITQALPEILQDKKMISLNELIAFYRSPAKYFLEKRLCLRLPQEEWADEESEPFAVDGLTAYQIKQDLLEKTLAAANDEQVLAASRAAGMLPVGVAGDYYFTSLGDEVREFAAKVAHYLHGRKLDKVNVDLKVGDYRLIGTVDDLYEEYMIHYRPAELKIHDYFRLWLNHLIIHAHDHSSHPQSSILLGEDGSWRFRKPENAAIILGSLIQYFALGQNQPLKFFPRSSWEYAWSIMQKQKSREDAIFAARNEWMMDNYGGRKAEAKEIAHKICFAGTIPLDAEFEKTTIEIMGELFAHLEKLE